MMQDPHAPVSRRTLALALAALLLVSGSLALLFAHANQVAMQTASATSTAGSRQTAATQAASTATAQAVFATAQVAGATAEAQSQATAQVQATATAAALAALNPDPTFKTLALQDPLTSNTSGWDENTVAGLGCEFSADGYHVSSDYALLFPICLLRGHPFSDLVYRVQMQILHGDCGGLIFRSSESGTPNLYYGEVCRQGFYEFVRQGGPGAGVLLTGTSGAIRQGLNATNTVAVVAHGATLALYVNQQYVASVTDATWRSGDIGMMAVATSGNGNGQQVVAETVYSTLYVWTR
jgi:eukaryotic-like serine/threonine-protein kinase